MTNNITTSTAINNNYNNTAQTTNPNTYIPTKVCKTCRTIKYVQSFIKVNQKKMVIILNVKYVIVIMIKNILEKTKIN